MSLNMSIRIIIKIFLVLQLLFLIFRQITDFAGIQWLMIIVNAVAIIVTITGFFGYLLLYASFQGFLILYNIFVICVYARLINVSSNDGSDPFDTSHLGNLDKTTFYQTDHFATSTRAKLPSTQLLSFDVNSRSFWYVMVSNHVSELHATIVNSPVLPNPSFGGSSATHIGSSSAAGSSHHQPSLVDESLVDMIVQYIEIAIACLHIFFSILGIGLIFLKYKLQRDKLFRNNDKTTPPLPPYTISPQMNHYMSYTPTQQFTTYSNGPSIGKGSTYSSHNTASLRRSKRHRRSTRSLHNSKSKANSMGALNIRTASTGSLRSISKQGYRKSATSLLMDNSCGNNTTIGSRGSRGGGGGGGYTGGLVGGPGTSGTARSNVSHHSSKGAIYQPMLPTSSASSSNYNDHYQPHNRRHSAYIQKQQTAQAKFLTSDSETDYYHTFTPSVKYGCIQNGLTNPLYGTNRHSYLNDSETAI